MAFVPQDVVARTYVWILLQTNPICSAACANRNGKDLNSSLSIFRKQLAHACLGKLVACKPRKSPMFETNSLDPMRLGRLNAALDKQCRFNGRVRSLRDHIAELAKDGPLDLSESDGMIDYSRQRFNRMSSQKEQDAYISRLKAKRYFYVNGWVVPKLVYDAIQHKTEQPVGPTLPPL